MFGLIGTIYMMFRVLKNEMIFHKYKESIIVCVLSFGTLALAVMDAFFSKDINIFIYVMFFSWIMLQAYVDYLCGYVYVAMEYMGIIIIIYCSVNLFLLHGKEASGYIITILVSILLFYVAVRCRMFGRGDFDMFAVACFVYADLIAVLSFYAVSTFLFLVRYIGCVIVNKGKLNEPKPFIPSLYMAHVLFILFYCI